MLFPRAIETRYKHYRFRSRLEARWAVFLDVLGFHWEYEKEGFDLGGVWYLPDFYLADIDCYAEVKPGNFSEQEIWKARQCACILLDGIPDVRWYLHVKMMEYIDGSRAYQQIHLPQSLRKGRPWYSTGESIRTYDNTLFTKAVAAARGARFEHGEQGTSLSAVRLHDVRLMPQTLPRVQAPAEPIALAPKNDVIAAYQRMRVAILERIVEWILHAILQRDGFDMSRDFKAYQRIKCLAPDIINHTHLYPGEDIPVLLPFLWSTANRVYNFSTQLPYDEYERFHDLSH